jgi:hypothetical protein
LQSTLVFLVILEDLEELLVGVGIVCETCLDLVQILNRVVEVVLRALGGSRSARNGTVLGVQVT